MEQREILLRDKGEVLLDTDGKLLGSVPKPVRWPSEAVEESTMFGTDGLGGPSYSSGNRVLGQSVVRIEGCTKTLRTTIDGLNVKL